MNQISKSIKPIVRISRIKIQNYMNVEHGEIIFPNPKTDDGVIKSSIVGIYGQNGSGKSAFIRSIWLLKRLGTIRRTTEHEYIRFGCSSAELSYDFSLTYPNGDVFSATYSFSLCYDKGKRETLIENQLLKCKGLINGEKKNAHIILASFGSTFMSLLEKPYIEKQNNFLIFDSRTVAAYSELKNDYDAIILNDLYDFIKNHLYTIGSTRIQEIYRQILLPIGDNGRIVALDYDLSTSSILKENSFGIEINDTTVGLIDSCLEKLSDVFQLVVPGVRICLAKEENSYVLSSERDGVMIPFSKESYGIQKIFSIIQLLVYVYNIDSCTLVVDELDEGIFEFLLGQILVIIKKGGRGQLIFTSHNLRPLEVLEKENIYFTTSNPSNRYIKMVSIKPHNNLRDTYFRAIQLGGQKEELYNETEEDEIETAFIVAGGVRNGE